MVEAGQAGRRAGCTLGRGPRQGHLDPRLLHRRAQRGHPAGVPLQPLRAAGRGDPEGGRAERQLGLHHLPHLQRVARPLLRETGLAVRHEADAADLLCRHPGDLRGLGGAALPLLVIRQLPAGGLVHVVPVLHLLHLRHARDAPAPPVHRGRPAVLHEHGLQRAHLGGGQAADPRARHPHGLRDPGRRLRRPAGRLHPHPALGGRPALRRPGGQARRARGAGRRRAPRAARGPLRVPRGGPTVRGLLHRHARPVLLGGPVPDDPEPDADPLRVRPAGRRPGPVLPVRVQPPRVGGDSAEGVGHAVHDGLFSSVHRQLRHLGIHTGELVRDPPGPHPHCRHNGIALDLDANNGHEVRGQEKRNPVVFHLDDGRTWRHIGPAHCFTL
mmetsp:Transcript_30246/g.85289  ORF Transcript_30246/g.85289 Transcript_30246/m.85289 type:complete len:385 (-) Transcript_30246:392-1546(-)